MARPPAAPQLVHGLPGHRVAPAWRERGERAQDEGPIAEACVRHHEPALVYDGAPVEHQIEVQRPGGTA
jgi:hypothetical protein